MGFDKFFLIVILVYLGSQSHGLFKCVTSGQEATEAQKGTPAQAGAVDPLVVIGAFDAKDADARADVDQHEGVDGGPDAVDSVQNLNLNFGHANTSSSLTTNNNYREVASSSPSRLVAHP